MVAGLGKLKSTMPKRNSPQDVAVLADLNHLADIVVDKRLGKRAEAKKNRRNRHYEKQFIRNALRDGLAEEG